MLTSLVPRPFARSLAARERDALCDLALTLDATAPTLCGGWSVKDLVIHLLVRERKPAASIGTFVPALAARTSRASAALASRDLASLVTQLRTVPLPLAVVDPLLNGMEMFVHHEDVRRAQPGWTARVLSGGDERHLWLAAATVGRMQARRAGVPLAIRSGARHSVLRRGDDPVVVSGPVPEVLLFLAGRSSVAEVSFDGPAEGVARVRGTALPI
ncbi:TIGR03085 family metal-binding protein [Nocardioides sp. CER19]|uniref:TIGR03085 family metal-binding protein n=1 Tax=Nocardioides sp. CER19 TaxID=3038538 RepID=UPI00244A0E15|nr:TIGR03085 family metal-binding protein [Nocardioides sp. CER19]MDH2416665.1 TIGR03085 family metal-binding protein [Nocardioides sp. CER19]